MRARSPSSLAVRPAGLRRYILTLGLALMTGLAWLGNAEAQEPGDLAARTAARVEAAVARPQAGRLHWQATQEALLASSDSDAGTTTMLWARRRALGVGMGVAQHDSTTLGRIEPRAAMSSLPPSGMPRSQALMVGVSLATSERTALALQVPVWSQAGAAEPATPKRMTLRGRDRAGELKDALQMKMTMGAGTTLALRPRKGGLKVSLQSQW